MIETTRLPASTLLCALRGMRPGPRKNWTVGETACALGMDFEPAWENMKIDGRLLIAAARDAYKESPQQECKLLLMRLDLKEEVVEKTWYPERTIVVFKIRYGDTALRVYTDRLPQ